MARSFSRLVAVGLAAALAGCASDPVPDIAYYHMQPANVPALPEGTAAALKMPIVVDALIGDGAHGEQAILYAGEDGGSLRGYHYQLWQDPPERMLQRRLIERLRADGVSSLVADDLSSSLRIVRVSGVINAFERVKSSGKWMAKVELELRADDSNGDIPLLLQTYTAQRASDDDSIQATVRAFAAATDEVLGKFSADLSRVHQ